MGTRRPLMLQMVHNPDATEPRVCLQDEDADSYGPTIMPETGEALALCPLPFRAHRRREACEEGAAGPLLVTRPSRQQAVKADWSNDGVHIGVTL